VGVAQLHQFRKETPGALGVIGVRGHGHQPPQRERRLGPDGLDGGGEPCGRAAVLLRLAPDVHLYQRRERERPAQLRGPLAELAREGWPVDRVDDLGMLGHQLRLVALHVADHMEDDPLQVGELACLPGELLGVVLAEVALPGEVRLADGRGGVGLRDRHQQHRACWPAGRALCCGEPRPDGLEVCLNAHRDPTVLAFSSASFSTDVAAWSRRNLSACSGSTGTRSCPIGPSTSLPRAKRSSAAGALRCV
jgi:hypothetical protein